MTLLTCKFGSIMPLFYSSGIIAAFYMADLPFEEHHLLYALTLPGFSAVQLMCYLLFGQTVVYKCYPLLIHLPLILLIRFVCHRNTYISIIAVLAAYLFCTPRKWFGTLIASFAGNDPMVSNIGAILITIPLLLLIIRYVAPCITRLQHESKMLLSLFMLLPIIYYILEYSFTVYTDLLYTGGAIVAEFMDSVIVILYFIFSMLSLEFSSQTHKAQQANVLLTAATTQAQKEICPAFEIRATGSNLPPRSAASHELPAILHSGESERNCSQLYQ